MTREHVFIAICTALVVASGVLFEPLRQRDLKTRGTVWPFLGYWACVFVGIGAALALVALSFVRVVGL